MHEYAWFCKLGCWFGLGLALKYAACMLKPCALDAAESSLANEKIPSALAEWPAASQLGTFLAEHSREPESQGSRERLVRHTCPSAQGCFPSLASLLCIPNGN
jgi:hypothetical protein